MDPIATALARLVHWCFPRMWMRVIFAAVCCVPIVMFLLLDALFIHPCWVWLSARRRWR